MEQEGGMGNGDSAQIRMSKGTGEPVGTGTVSDLFSMKSHLHEDIWSEIIKKHYVVLVLHVCHMEILLQIVTGLKAENGLLQHGLCESNSLVSQL